MPTEAELALEQSQQGVSYEVSQYSIDDPNVEVNDGNVEHDKSAHDQHDNELELLAKSAYKEAEKKHILAKKFKVHANVCDTEEILEDATKSQIKMENKLKDPIAIEKKQNFRPINYEKLNDLYETFVPQVELSLEQTYFPEASTSSVTPTSANKFTSLTNIKFEQTDSPFPHVGK
ncbi:hypothetical protein Tco_1211317 [Tanacetum coccineum]